MNLSLLNSPFPWDGVLRSRLWKTQNQIKRGPSHIIQLKKLWKCVELGCVGCSRDKLNWIEPKHTHAATKRHTRANMWIGPLSQLGAESDSNQAGSYECMLVSLFVKQNNNNISEQPSIRQEQQVKEVNWIVLSLSYIKSDIWTQTHRLELESRIWIEWKRKRLNTFMNELAFSWKSMNGNIDV